jgi:hypothetical protein
MNTTASTMENHVPHQPTSGLGDEANYLIKRIGGALSVLDYFSFDTPVTYIAATGKTKRRFTLEELLQGATQESMDELHRLTSFNQEGGPIGRELA